jgi:hypothetical protein
MKMPARLFMISVCLAVISQMGVAQAQSDSAAEWRSHTAAYARLD